jgi:hypothetical protein
VAFVGKGHLMNVASEVVNFIKNGDSFVNYKRPDAILDNEKVRKD